MELYGRVKDAATQGRAGLGRSSVLKIAGGRWQGKKTKLDSDSESDDDDRAAGGEGDELVAAKLVMIEATSA